MRRWIRRACLALIVVSCSAVAQACPSCREANATDARLPFAYQSSILFMLAVPGTLASVLGFGLYRLNQQQEAALEAFESGQVWEGPAEPDAMDDQA